MKSLLPYGWYLFDYSYLSGLSLLFSIDYHLFSTIKDRYPVLIRYRCIDHCMLLKLLFEKLYHLLYGDRHEPVCIHTGVIPEDLFLPVPVIIAFI